MALEIEVKAHVDDYQQLLNLIRKTEGICSELYQEKCDIYFSREGEIPSLRSRKEISTDSFGKSIGKTIITYKDKQSIKDIENNHEIEFDCNQSNFEKTIELFLALGYKVALKKEKKGYSFILKYFMKDLHVELIEVKPLGWFIEMEFCLPDNSSEIAKKQAQEDLYKALELFHIDKTKIEKRFYMDLL